MNPLPRSFQVAGHLPRSGDHRLGGDAGVRAVVRQAVQRLLGTGKGEVCPPLAVALQSVAPERCPQRRHNDLIQPAGVAFEQRLDAVENDRSFDLTTLVMHQPGLQQQQFRIHLDGIGRQQAQASLQPMPVLPVEERVAMTCQQLPGCRAPAAASACGIASSKQAVGLEPGGRSPMQFDDLGVGMLLPELRLQKLRNRRW
jgi:hypothetical protein